MVSQGKVYGRYDIGSSTDEMATESGFKDRGIYNIRSTEQLTSRSLRMKEAASWAMHEFGASFEKFNYRIFVPMSILADTIAFFHQKADTLRYLVNNFI